MQSEGHILRRVDQIRAHLPELGGRKLYLKLSDHLEMGRDKFFDLLRRHGRLIPKRKRKGPRTTDSNHGFKYWSNLLKDLEPERPNQAWVSDITYLSTTQGFVYASLITDAYSRKIVGFHLSGSLAVEGTLKALKMALKQRRKKEPLIHHSDRGVQYSCHAYTGLLKKHKIQISMAATGNCYENAMAERVNGILKYEFYLNTVFRDLKQARRALKEAVRLYNEERPHMSIGYLTPQEKHAA